MVKIRLQRGGSKNNPHYRLIAADARSPRDGKFLEILGHYHPTMAKNQFVFQEDKILKWLDCGAQPTDTAKDLIKKSGVWTKYRDFKKTAQAEK